MRQKDRDKKLHGYSLFFPSIHSSRAILTTSGFVGGFSFYRICTSITEEVP